MSLYGAGIEANEINNGFGLNEGLQVSLRMSVEVACVEEEIKQAGSKGEDAYFTQMLLCALFFFHA